MNIKMQEYKLYFIIDTIKFPKSCCFPDDAKYRKLISLRYFFTDKIPELTF